MKKMPGVQTGKAPIAVRLVWASKVRVVWAESCSNQFYFKMNTNINLASNLNNEREPNFRRVFGAPELTARAGICV